MTEEDASGHYKADFDASTNITTAGMYYVVVYLQAGANPADSDVALAQGEIAWDGASEITPYTIWGAAFNLGQTQQIEDTVPGRTSRQLLGE
jgi:hypothetical protein